MVNKVALFDELAKNIPAGKFTIFANKMGFNFSEATNMLDRWKENSYTAMKYLLEEWDERMNGVNQEQIEKALDEAEIGRFHSIVRKHYKKASSASSSVEGRNQASGTSIVSQRDADIPHGGNMKSNVQEPEDWNEMKYYMSNVKKGYALIIANKTFESAAARPWAKKDVDIMEGLLKFLGYQSVLQYDLPADQEEYPKGMKQHLKEFKQHLEKDNPQSAFVYISSHGSAEGIHGVKGGLLPIEYLLELFTNVLPGKPKILIIDACWGGSKTKRVSTAVPNAPPGPSHTFCIPENADVFIIHSTSYGKISWSDEAKGSWFVQDLDKVVREHNQEDLDTMLLRVARLMRRREGTYQGQDTGTQSTTLIKQGVDRKLYFFP